MMPSLLIVHVQSLERAEAADKAARLERCKLGGATDIKPQTRKDPATRAKFEDVGLDPETDSKWQLGGTLSIKPDKGCNDVHFDSIRDKKDFANAADARAGGWRVVKGHKSKTTDIQSWRLITK